MNNFKIGEEVFFNHNNSSMKGKVVRFNGCSNVVVDIVGFCRISVPIEFISKQ